MALRQEGNANVAYVSGGKVRHTDVGGRIARLSFNGNGIGFVTTLGLKRGIAQVWLDGTHVATLDLYAPSRHTRVVAWSTSVPTGSHVVEIRATGTRSALSGSNRIDIDAFIVQQ